MKIPKPVIIVSSVLLAIISVLVLYFGKKILINKFKISLITTVESSTGLGVKIENAGFIPFKGIRLLGVSVYRNNLYEKELLSVPSVSMKFSLRKLLMGKIFSPDIAIQDLKGEGFSVNGSLGLEMNLPPKDAPEVSALETIDEIRFRNLSVKSAFLNIENIKGEIDLTPNSITSSPINFALNGEPCELNFKIDEPLGELSSELTVSSPKINLSASIKKEGEIYKIPNLEGKVLNSPFSFMGEFESLKPPTLSLYGNATLFVKDASAFLPQNLKGPFDYLKPEGALENSVYFKGNLQDPQGWELGIKSGSESLKVWGIDVTGLRMDARIEEGTLKIPLLNAYLYGGTMTSQMNCDLITEGIPYRINCKLSNVDVRKVIANTNLNGKNIKGSLFSEVSVRGKAKDINSVEGPGKLVVRDANLGPMPLLTPLVGNLYGYFQSVMPALKRVAITDASADFYIGKRRITTQNLVLFGEVVSVHARGYVDFDKQINFEVENQFRKTKGGGDDWEASLEDMIVEFGKLISKARLTGTLQKPKWKFEYLSGVQNIIKGGFKRLLKDILE